MRIRARVEEASHRRQRLVRTAEAIRTEANAALRAGAAMIVASARRRVIALRDPERRLPSSLANSISVEDGPHGVEVVARADYAAYVEFGTRIMPAQPFLGPALEENRAAICARVAEAVAGIQETVR